MKKILITGLGLVGAQIVKILAEEHDIQPVTLDLCFQWDYLDTILERDMFVPVEGSLLDQNLVARILKEHNITHIIHTAAVLPMRVGHDAHPGFYQVNIWGTAGLMFLAARHNVERFVMFSTNGVYQFRKYGVKSEVDEEYPIGLTSHNSYGNSKATVEYLLRELTNESAFDGKIIRPGEIYGPVMNRRGDDSIFWKAMFDAAIDGKKYVLKNHPEHRLDWVYVLDVARLASIVTLADFTPSIAYHASSGSITGIYDLKEKLDYLFPNNKVVLENCEKGGWNYPLSMKKASDELNFEPQFTLKDGIKNYTKWYTNIKNG